MSPQTMALQKEIFMKKKVSFSKMIQNCEKQLNIQPHWVGYGLEVGVPPLGLRASTIMFSCNGKS